MYALSGYGRMVADERRTAAYGEAIARSIVPDSVVVDLGAGTGLLTLLACRAGARRVYAVDLSPHLDIARRIVQANGFADRVEFIEGDSRHVQLPERADALVADVRGVLPLVDGSVHVLLDARDRLVRPGGAIVPLRERIVCAVGSAPATYATLVEPWIHAPAGFDMAAAAELAVNGITAIPSGGDAALSPGAAWVDLDYSTLTAMSFAGRISLACDQRGLAHGLTLWFESTLAEGVVLSTAPSMPPLVYGRALLPWPQPVSCVPGTRVDAEIRADYLGGEYIWTWRSTIHHADGAVQRFSQSTFAGPGWSPERLHRRSAAFVPTVGPDAEINATAIALIQQGLSLGEIAARLRARFPDRLANDAAALERAADVAERVSR